MIYYSVFKEPHSCDMTDSTLCIAFENVKPFTTTPITDLIKLSAAHDKVRGESETMPSLSCHMLSPDFEGQVREHRV